MKKQAVALVIVLGLSVILGGCPPVDPDGGQTTELTEAQQAAIDSVTAQLHAMIQALSTVGSLNDDRVGLGGLSLIGLYGTCPQVSWVATAQTAVMTFNFGTAGCSSDATGGLTVAGRVDLNVTRATDTAAITFAEMTIDGVGVSGTASLTVTGTVPNLTLTGTVDIEVDGVGAMAGNVTVELSDDGITIPTGSLTLDDGTDTFTVTLDDVVIQPQGDGNLIPNDGTATFGVPGDSGTVTLVITFTADSPTDGVVEVSAGGAGAIEYTLPGF